MRVRRLVDDYFDWQGARPESQEERLGYVQRWLEQQTAIYRMVTTALIARIEPLLASLYQELPSAERGRLLYRIDDGHVLKTPESILEKMSRKWKNTDRPPPISFENLDELNDLGRFRIVTNFLSDALWISQRLEEPYDAMKRERLSLHQQALRREFGLQSNRFEDLISLAPAERETGERCRKGHFMPLLPEYRGFRVEVQILTVLQEAWDKKDHFLIYERRRAGLHVQEEHERISFSLSEQLYLADLLFDQIKRAHATQEKSRTAEL
jgi:ppGpp synthetase/RelA/SpoT-type nucleotidyltranferase